MTNVKNARKDSSVSLAANARITVTICTNPDPSPRNTTPTRKRFRLTIGPTFHEGRWLRGELVIHDLKHNGPGSFLNGR